MPSTRARGPKALLRGASLRRKLMAVIVAVSAFVILVAGGSYLVLEYRTAKVRLVEDLTILAAVSAENLAAALAFDSPRDARMVLEPLRAKPSILAASVLTLEGVVFTAYMRNPLDPVPATKEVGHRFGPNLLEVVIPVQVEGEHLGFLCIRSDLREIRSIFAKSLAALGAVSLLSLSLAFGLASVLQRIVTRPIAHLAEVAKAISREGRFDLRAGKFDDDEVGLLTDAFNGMLDNLQERDVALAVSEEKFRTIFQTTPDVITLSRIEDGVLLEVNEGFVRITGYPREEVLGRSSTDIGLWLDAVERKAFVESLRRHGRIDNQEIRFRIRGGSIVTGLASATVITIRGVSVLLMVVRDITELKITEESLRISESRNRALLDALPDILFRLDSNGAFVDVKSSPSMPLLMEPELFLGRRADDVLPQDLAEALRRSTLRALAGGGLQVFEYQLDLQGEHKEFEARLVAMGGEQVMVLIRDITDRKAAERELRRYQEHLEELVVDRTRALEAAQAELVRSERLAVLGQLTATVSHEIRNPLGTVRNSLYSIRDALEKGHPERVERAMNLAERNVRRCDTIISELLDYTRRSKPVVEELELDAWVRETLAEMAPTPGVRLETVTASGMRVLADREALRRAVVNVYTNAVQAITGRAEGEEGGAGRLAVSTAEAGDRVEIRLQDDGPGIPPEVLPKVFEPLFSTKSFGVGLGLPIVRKIMEDLRGGVEIRSEVGKGTTVTLWLPPAPGRSGGKDG